VAAGQLGHHRMAGRHLGEPGRIVAQTGDGVGPVEDPFRARAVAGRDQ
jgi:hypothetical protein